MTESVLDELRQSRLDLAAAEDARRYAIAKRDRALRRSWRERLPQSQLAKELGISLQRAGHLRRRARQTLGPLDVVLPVKPRADWPAGRRGTIVELNDENIATVEVNDETGLKTAALVELPVDELRNAE